MLYADFCFKMQGALCVAGWTQGEVSAPVLRAEGGTIPAAALRTHRRADLPEGATGFILRFDAASAEGAVLAMDAPARETALPDKGIDALLSQAPDEVIVCLMIGVSEGLFRPRAAGYDEAAHRRAKAMAANSAFSELPGAAVAQDQAMCFPDPPRVLVTGWSGDDGKAAATKAVGLILDAEGAMEFPVEGDALLRPDLAGVQIRALRVGVTSGFLGAARLPRVPGPEAVCFVGLIHGDTTAGTVRPLTVHAATDLGHHHASLRRALVDPISGPALLAPLLPALPDHDALPAQPEPALRSGVAALVEHDLDDWILRDTLRLLRRSEPALCRTGIVADRISEGLFRATLAEREESGPEAAPVDLIPRIAGLASWAAGAQHLVVSTSVTLFQLLPFADFAQARMAGVEAAVHLLSDRVENPGQTIEPEVAIEDLAKGHAFAAQIDLGRVAIAEPAEAGALGALSQMRWLLLNLAGAGRLRCIASPARAFRPGRAPGTAQIRMLELEAMRRVLGGAVQ